MLQCIGGFFRSTCASSQVMLVLVHMGSYIQRLLCSLSMSEDFVHFEQIVRLKYILPFLSLQMVKASWAVHQDLDSSNCFDSRLSWTSSKNFHYEATIFALKHEAVIKKSLPYENNIKYGSDKDNIANYKISSYRAKLFAILCIFQSSSSMAPSK